MTSSFPILRLEEPATVEAHLRKLGWLEDDAQFLGVEPAGEGNMNLVVRVSTSNGTFILKQSRPWVEKYPSIAAPQDRLLVEAAFYTAVAGTEFVAAGMPRLLAVDQGSRCAWMEDLGESVDCTDMYGGATGDLSPLMAWLAGLHSLKGSPAQRSQLRNRSMRELNHAHIFDLPMTGAHGMDLDSITTGLGKLAEGFRADAPVAAIVREMGAIYLSDGKTLLHGDYYPGSWLRTEFGVRVIDPEFCFFGPAEFDLGVFRAHLLLSGWPQSEMDMLDDVYGLAFNRRMRDRFAGIEIMRRLVGVAQLPFVRSLEEKRTLLDQARDLILS